MMEKSETATREILPWTGLIQSSALLLFTVLTFFSFLIVLGGYIEEVIKPDPLPTFGL